jgi:hypothetical protein
MVLDHCNTGIVGPNPSRGMDVYPRFLLCCAMYVEAFAWANHPSKDPYENI